MGMLDAAVVAAALGEAVAPVPFAGRNVMAPLAFIEAGTEAQKAQWLPKMASGEARFGVGVQQLVSNRDGSGLLCTDGTLTGAALFVLDCEGADSFLVAAQTGRLHIVSMAAAGLQMIYLQPINSTRPGG